MNACPYCQTDINPASEPCEHWVAILLDDGDGLDVSTPLFWGRLDFGFSEDLQDAFDAYFNALCEACDKVATRGELEAQRMLAETRTWPPDERTTLKQAIEAIEQPRWRDDYADVQGYVRDELAKEMWAMFAALFQRYRGAKNASGNMISDRPGSSWSSTSYFAQDAAQCVRVILSECQQATHRLQALTSRCQ